MRRVLPSCHPLEPSLAAFTGLSGHRLPTAGAELWGGDLVWAAMREHPQFWRRLVTVSSCGERDKRTLWGLFYNPFHEGSVLTT